MNKAHLLKGVLFGLAVASSTAAEARYFEIISAQLDASQNLYTASYYPSSTKLRVSKRSSTNTSPWVHDFTAASGWRFDRYMILRRDSAGNIYIAATQSQTSGTNSRYVVYKLNSSGNIVGSPATYAPAPSGQSCFLGGFAIDGADKPILVGSYNTGSGSQGFALKYTSFPSASVQAVSSGLSGYSTMVDDIVIDASNNVYVSGYSYPGAGTAWYSTITKFTSAFGAGTPYNDALPTNWFPINSGCLTLDSSGLLTYLHGVNGPSGSDVFGTQRNTAGTLTWTPSLLGLTDMDTASSVVDASGNIYVTGAATNSVYEVAKISPTKTLLWSNTQLITDIYPRMIKLDAGGDPLVVTSTPSGGGNVSRVMRFSNSTGTQVGTYNYSGAANMDYGYEIFPSSTSGTFYVAGIGNSGGSYYPLTYKYTFSPTPTLNWSNYQTALIP